MQIGFRKNCKNCKCKGFSCIYSLKIFFEFFFGGFRKK